MAFFKQLHKGLEDYSNSLDSLANDIRSFGTVFGNMIKGSLLSNISLLVPNCKCCTRFNGSIERTRCSCGGALGVAVHLVWCVVAFGAMGISALKCYLTVRCKQLEKQSVIKHH